MIWVEFVNVCAPATAGSSPEAPKPRHTVIASKYGRIRVLKRKKLQDAACECYEVIRAHFRRLGL